MLLASVLTGSYAMDASTIDLTHLVFSLNPALWEELFYRGVLMILLLRYTGSLMRASAIQAVLFGMAHIKGLDAWAFVDVFTVIVISIGFTYAAYKTRSLVAGVTFHYFHDALLKFVQIPATIDPGATHRAFFYVILWVMVGVGCVVTKLAVDRFGVRAPAELYRYEGV
jgi:membrane protease YdiL (CAAX protease family)